MGLSTWRNGSKTFCTKACLPPNPLTCSLLRRARQLASSVKTRRETPRWANSCGTHYRLTLAPRGWRRTERRRVGRFPKKATQLPAMRAVPTRRKRARMRRRWGGRGGGALAVQTALSEAPATGPDDTPRGKKNHRRTPPARSRRWPGAIAREVGRSQTWLRQTRTASRRLGGYHRLTRDHPGGRLPPPPGGSTGSAVPRRGRMRPYRALKGWWFLFYRQVTVAQVLGEACAPFAWQAAYQPKRADETVG